MKSMKQSLIDLPIIHLHPDSTTAIYEAEALLRAGDPPTKRLAAPWRERAEDAVWALLLTPEFSFLP